MDDMISRRAAIDALNEYFARIGKLKRRGLNKGEKAISLDTVGVIETLPSVQPEKMQLLEEDATKDTTFPVDGEPIDCISRQQAILAIERNAYRCEDINETEHIILWVLDIIKWLPSAQPQRMRGKWIDKDGGLATCSECGDRWGVWSVMNYCPNCGADMRGTE